MDNFTRCHMHLQKNMHKYPEDGRSIQEFWLPIESWDPKFQ